MSAQQPPGGGRVTTQQAHTALLTLGIELLFVFALATVAEATPGWAPVVVMLLLLLWGLLLVTHTDQLQRLMRLLGQP